MGNPMEGFLVGYLYIWIEDTIYGRSVSSIRESTDAAGDGDSPLVFEDKFSAAASGTNASPH